MHYPYFEPFFLSLPFRSQQKRVVTVHDLTPFVFKEHFPAGLKGKLRWQLQKYLLGKSEEVITDSECSKRDIIRFTNIPEEKINVVYLSAGEEFKRIKNQESRIKKIKRKYKLPEKFVLYVGDVTWNKNLPRLLEAATKANTKLVIVGKAIIDKNFDKNNPWNQDLVKVQKYIALHDNILALGFVSSEELVLIYNMATLFCMPSLYEGFGLPILEAMRCGCPTISTKEGSLPEIGGEAVMYVDAYDSESIAKGIKKLIENPSLQEYLRQKGYEQSALFTWEKTSKDTIRVYEKIAAK